MDKADTVLTIMPQLTLPIRPEEATKQLLKKLPSKRMRDVLEKRFGLKGGKKKTLEAVGREYRITRERVRQIETDALKQLAKPENYHEVEPIFQTLEGQFGNHGGVMAEHYLLGMLPSSKQASHVAFLLQVGKQFTELAENVHYHRRWTTNKNTALSAEKILERTKNELAEKGQTVSIQELHSMLSRGFESSLGYLPEEQVRHAYLATSKLILQNPYGEYGLIDWPTISPRGVKDKAYLVLTRSKKPLHFRDVASEINKAGWIKKKAHPQTVHNELIKDNRFVLVGRGLYGLKEWGYEPGTVKDILVSVMKKAARPLSRDEVVGLVLEKRFVKPPTVLLNLQDRSTFKRTENEKYTLT